MSSFATNTDRFVQYGLTQEQFIAAYEIAKIRHGAAKENIDIASDQDVINYLGIEKHPSIISKIKSGASALKVTEKLLGFINTFAPQELPQQTKDIIAQWNDPVIKNNRGS